MTVSTDLQAIEKRTGIFLTSHHIILYVLLAVALLTGVYLIGSKRASVSEAKAQAAEQALAVEKDHGAQMVATLKQAQDALVLAQVQRNKENASFLQTIAQLQSQTKVQIIHDKALPAPELGRRIETITGFKQGAVTLDPLQNLIIPLLLGQEIVARLDQGEADAQTVQQQDRVITNQAATINDQTAIINDQTAIIAEDKVVLAKQIKTDGEVLSAEKANSRKGKLKWFGIGVILGFTGRVLSGH